MYRVTVNLCPGITLVSSSTKGLNGFNGCILVFVLYLSIVNKPTNYDFKLVTKRLDITVVGDQEILDQLDINDIIVTVDLFGYDVEQYPSESFTWPAAISFYQQGRVWAVGSYRIALDRSELHSAQSDEEE